MFYPNGKPVPFTALAQHLVRVAPDYHMSHPYPTPHRKKDDELTLLKAKVTELESRLNRMNRLERTFQEIVRFCIKWLRSYSM